MVKRQYWTIYLFLFLPNNHFVDLLWIIKPKPLINERDQLAELFEMIQISMRNCRTELRTICTQLASLGSYLISLIIRK